MDIKEVKQRFFALRNGIVADAYHKAGDPHKVVFGLQLPQLTQLMRDITATATPAQVAMLAAELCADREVRESRLLGYMLAGQAGTDSDRAMALAQDIRTQEEADILAFRLLRHLPDPAQMLTDLRGEGGEATTRCAMALARFVE